MGKSRPKGQPWLVFENKAAGWRWEVLKSWQMDNRKPFARWFCNVTSPYTGSYGDMGDTYVDEILRYAVETYRDPSLEGMVLY